MKNFINYFRVFPLIHIAYKRFAISTKTFSELLIDVLRRQKISSLINGMVDNYGAKHIFHHSHVGLQFMSSAYRYFIALCLFSQFFVFSPHFIPGPRFIPGAQSGSAVLY